MAGYDRDNDATVLADHPASWETYLASAVGADHVRAGMPNQDAIAATKFEFPDAPGLLVFAVADGHGHARHFRSDRGSKLGVKAGVSAARSWAQKLPAGAPISQAAVSELVTDVVTTWRELVAADLTQDPLSEAQRATVLPDDPAEIPYGATLLLGALRPDVAVLAQIGDGEILLVLPDGRHLAPVPADSRLDGTSTTSLCQPDATSAFRAAVVNLARTEVFAVLAATDGYGNAQADADWQQAVAADLVRMGSERGLEWIGGQLSGWVTLCASSRGSGDDSTVALALNGAAVLAPPATPERPPRADRVHDGQTLPYRRPAATDQTLTWPGKSAKDDAPPGSARAAPAYGSAFTAARPAAAHRPVLRRPALWLTAAVIALLAVVAAVLLSSHGHSARSPAFRPNPRPAHSSAKPTRSPRLGSRT